MLLSPLYDARNLIASTLVVIGANSHLKLYQQHFLGPGIDVETSVVSTNPSPLIQPINITYIVVPIRFIQNITVCSLLLMAKCDRSF